MRTIQCTCKKLKESKDPRRVITRAPKSLDDCRKLRDANFVKRVETMMDINPSKSMRSMAAELGIDKRTIQRCVDKDLRCKSYRMQTGQLLTQATKNRRLLNSTKLINKLKQPKESNMLWLFSDEKNFCQDQAHNRQNHRWIAMCPNNVPRVMKTKFPNTVMIFGVMPPQLPWIKQVAWGRPWVWQQNSAPCHVSKCYLAWLEEHCYDFVTKDKSPPSSLDLNPMDYFFWGILKNQTNRHPHTTKASFIASIKEQCISIDREMVKKACGSFRTKIEHIIEAEGNYVE